MAEIIIIGGATGNVLGSAAFDCSSCGEKVILSPSGQAMLKEHPDASILCVQCALKQWQEEGAPQIMPLTQQRDEIQETLKHVPLTDFS